MTSAWAAIGMLSPSAPAPTAASHFPTAVVVIVLILAVLGGLAILGWRSPDRSPGADSKAERDRVDD